MKRKDINDQFLIILIITMIYIHIYHTFFQLIINSHTISVYQILFLISIILIKSKLVS